MYALVKTRFRTMMSTFAVMFLLPVAFGFYMALHALPGPRAVLIFLFCQQIMTIAFFVFVWKADRHFQSHDAASLRARLRAWMGSQSEKS